MVLLGEDWFLQERGRVKQPREPLCREIMPGSREDVILSQKKGKYRSHTLSEGALENDSLPSPERYQESGPSTRLATGEGQKEKRGKKGDGPLKSTPPPEGLKPASRGKVRAKWRRKNSAGLEKTSLMERKRNAIRMPSLLSQKDSEKEGRGNGASTRRPEKNWGAFRGGGEKGKKMILLEDLRSRRAKKIRAYQKRHRKSGNPDGGNSILSPRNYFPIPQREVEDAYGRVYKQQKERERV